MPNEKREKVVEFNEIDLLLINPDQDATTNLKDLVGSRPAILSFIMGTWCPKCDNYIQSLIGAADILNRGTGPEVFLVSTESNKKLRNYFDKGGNMDQLPFRVISDKNKSLVNIFGLKIPIFGFARPAAVLVQCDQSWRILSKGLPSEEQLMNYECSFIPSVGDLKLKQEA